MLYYFDMDQTRPEEFGYDYTMNLCSAIEQLTAQEIASDEKKFTYKSTNLRYALERSLYFNYANDDLLFDIFGQWKMGDLPKKIEVEDNLQKKLVSVVCKCPEERIVIIRSNIAHRFKIALKFIAKFILRLGIDDTISGIRKSLNRRIQKNAQYDVLFFVLNERFVKYMKPVFDILPVRCAFITHDKKTESFLSREKIPYVKISHFLYNFTRWSQDDCWTKRFRLLEDYDILHDTIERIHPKSVALVEGNAPIYEVVNQICKKLGIQSVCIQQGWSPIVHNGFRNMTYSKMLVWGEGFARDLAKYNPQQKFVATGNHIIEKITVPKVPKKSNEKIKLGFLPPMQTKILSQKKLDKFMSLVPWATNEFKNAEIRISQHPTISKNERLEKLSEYDNVTFMSSLTHTLQDIIGDNDIVVSFYSTTILESIAAGALPVIVNLTSMPHYFPDVHAMKAGIELKSVEEAKKILRGLVSNPEKISHFNDGMEEFRRQYFYAGKEQAIKNIVNEIMN